MSTVAKQEYAQSYKTWLAEHRQAPLAGGAEPEVPPGLTQAEARGIRDRVQTEVAAAEGAK
jgi:hypothetical protein